MMADGRRHGATAAPARGTWPLAPEDTPIIENPGDGNEYPGKMI